LKYHPSLRQREPQPQTLIQSGCNKLASSEQLSCWPGSNQARLAVCDQSLSQLSNEAPADRLASEIQSSRSVKSACAWNQLI